MSALPDLAERVLLQEGLLEKLTPSEPLNWDMLPRIRDTADADLAGGLAIADRSALALFRGLLLYGVDALDACHAFFQDDPSPLGSYCHGMMHRREGDFDNARYWFRRAGVQPFFERLHRDAAQYSSVMARQQSWDPYLFTGECEQAKFGAEENLAECRKLLRAEWEAALGYCWRQAVPE